MILLLTAAAASLPAAPATTVHPQAVALGRADAAPPAPVVPRGLDTRAIAVEAPEVELALLDPKVGPMLRIGALGGRHNAAPKLAHIAVGWRF